MARVLLDGERCKACALCVDACPQGVLAMGRTCNRAGYTYARVERPMLCLGCCLCAITCPDVAIRLESGATAVRYFRT